MRGIPCSTQLWGVHLLVCEVANGQKSTAEYHQQHAHALRQLLQQHETLAGKLISKQAHVHGRLSSSTGRNPYRWVSFVTVVAAAVATKSIHQVTIRLTESPQLATTRNLQSESLRLHGVESAISIAEVSGDHTKTEAAVLS